MHQLSKFIRQYSFLMACCIVLLQGCAPLPYYPASPTDAGLDSLNHRLRGHSAYIFLEDDTYYRGYNLSFAQDSTRFTVGGKDKAVTISTCDIRSMKPLRTGRTFGVLLGGGLVIGGAILGRLGRDLADDSARVVGGVSIGAGVVMIATSVGSRAKELPPCENP